MQKINSEAELRTAIVQLEIRQAEEGRLLKEQFQLVYESIKPINLIRSTLKDAVASRGLKEDVLNASVGLSAGYISKAVFEGVTSSPFKKIIGTALMFGIKNVVARNPETIKTIGRFVFQHIFRKKTQISS